MPPPHHHHPPSDRQPIATSTLGKQGTRMSGWEFSKEIEKQDKENSLVRVAFVAWSKALHILTFRI